MILLSSIHNPPLTPSPASPRSHFVSRADRLRRYISFDSSVPCPIYFPAPVPNLELHSAAASGNVGLVHYALTHGQPVNSVLHGVLPLHAACSGGSVSVVRMLIENGADVNAPRLPRRYSDGKKGTAPSVGTAGSTPLHFAAANGHAPVVQMLLASGADATKPDKNGNTPEDLATINGHEDVVHVLHVYHHMQHQDALNDPANSDRAEPSSPSGSTSHLPDDEEISIHSRPTWVGSRKGKERAFSLTSTTSESAGRVKKSLEGLLRRGSRHSFADNLSEHRSGFDSPRSDVSGSRPNVIPRISTTSDISSVNESDHLQSPVDLDLPGSPSPQKGNDRPLISKDSDVSGQGSPVSLSRVTSGHSSHSNGTSIVLGSPPHSAGPPPPQPRGRLNSTSSHRPTLPSILEKAVHPGQAFRAAMRHHHDKDQHSHSSLDPANDNTSHENDHTSHGGGLFRGRRKSSGTDDTHHRKHKHGFKGLFRRGGHSPPSRSPSPPMKSDSTKPMAAEEIEEGIERLKRASLDMERQNQEAAGIDNEQGAGIDPRIIEAISLNDEDEYVDAREPTPQQPLSAPVTKTKFFPDSPGLPSRLQHRASDVPLSSATTPGQSGFNRPRTGSEVIAPSPLANEWAHDDDSDSSLQRAGIRRVKTEIIKSPISSSPLSPDSEASSSSPTSLGHVRRRSATHSGGLPSPILSTITKALNPPRLAGLGWEDDVDLRKVAASGLIRRESQRRLAEVDAEFDAEDDVYHDALSPGLEAQQSEISDQLHDQFEKDDDSTPTPPSTGSANESTPTAQTEDSLSIHGRLRGASVGSNTTDSSRHSTPSASFRMSAISDNPDDVRNQRNQTAVGSSGTASTSIVDGRPRGISVSSIASTTSGMGYSYAQSTSTPPTSLTTPSALSLALLGGSGGFPPVPEDEVASITSAPLNRRTISSHAEAKEAVKRNESDIFQLAQLPPSLDSSRSLAEQLAAYGENYAIERQFAEIERRSSGLTPRSEDGESFFSAQSSNRSGGSSKSSERGVRRPGSAGGVHGRALSNPLVPLVSVDAPRSSLPSINNIYDKRADAYRKHMATLTSAQQPLLPPSSTRHAHKRARQRAVSAQEMWLTAGPSNAQQQQHSRPASLTANSLMSYATAKDDEDDLHPHISSPFPVTSNPITGQRPRKSSFGSIGSTTSHSNLHGRSHTAPSRKYAAGGSTSNNPITDNLAGRYHGLSPSTMGRSATSASASRSLSNPNPSTSASMGISPYVSIFSNRYQPKVPLNDDDSDDENDNNREYTVIENDWRGGHIVRPDELGLSTGSGEKKKWSLKKLSRK
ncbi:uncharacterized protein I303_105173 [Kwoniella dejecticola CBS 10117]|uniref:Uncharacterized protein n=1 Tax=Kwoniella dejecticola CBS 10117 TaxID=1296121 RepID=A0A1A6A380_9TREE|nr:uncharacterized protein I303_05380 [Kwoniella dejecticola CBS 10117]OBR84522.1 hypothetical protein I303_05380 [Kwoniella dejecticola CBS 10117]